ncbi:MAG: hypothetical protein LBB44_01565 [Endomicrobium sp.]|jgi:beta-lactamase superfamily II metal-dependent hydrolase|nr:hypothetical protein [Endomicrobium sp.]
MNKLVVTFYNVGHGNCTHIITPTNQHILVDIGSLEEYSISEFLRTISGQIDMLHLTRPHKDHLYDLARLKEVGLSPRILSIYRRAFPVKHLYNQRLYNSSNNQRQITKWQLQQSLDKKIQQTANDFYNIYTMPVSWNSNPLNPEYNSGVTIKIDFPPNKYINPDDQNSYSSLISIEYYDVKILLTGDNNRDMLKERILDDTSDLYSLSQYNLFENSLRARNWDVNLDHYRLGVKKNSFTDFIMNHHVLLAPHHGRTTDFCKEFFDLVNPNLTIVSDKSIEYDSQDTTSDVYNNNNKKGLVVNKMERKVLTTRKDGTIKLMIYENEEYEINTGIKGSFYGYD